MNEQNDMVVGLFGTQYAASSLSNQTKTLINNYQRLQKEQSERQSIFNDHRSLLAEYELLIKNSLEGVEPLPEVEQPAAEPTEEEKQDE